MKKPLMGFNGKIMINRHRRADKKQPFSAQKGHFYAKKQGDASRTALPEFTNVNYRRFRPSQVTVATRMVSVTYILS